MPYTIIMKDPNFYTLYLDNTESSTILLAESREQATEAFLESAYNTTEGRVSFQLSELEQIHNAEHTYVISRRTGKLLESKEWLQEYFPKVYDIIHNTEDSANV
jgi:hypothetical protein